MRFYNVGKCTERNIELEKLLGDPPGLRTHKIKDANAYNEVLEARYAAKAPPAPPAKVASPATVKPAAPPVTQPPAVKLTGIAAVRACAINDIAASLARPGPNFTPKALPTPESSTEEQAERPTRQQCIEILKIVQPSAGPMPDAWTDGECFSEVERAVFQIHLRIPGMRTEAELSDEYWRTEKPTGMNLYLKAEAKRRIQKILNK